MENLTLKKPSPKTLTLLFECVSYEYAWRITELSNFKAITKTSEKGKKQNALIRAGVTLIYAHWEGFIKAITHDYYLFVSEQKLKVNQLINSFIGILIKSEIEQFSSTNKIAVQNKTIDLILSEGDKVANFPSNSPIKTSNLTYPIFQDICELIGFNIIDFEDRFRQKGKNENVEKLINKKLVEYRNTIAHGNYLSISLEEFLQIYDDVVNGLLFCFKELLLDAANNKKYLK